MNQLPRAALLAAALLLTACGGGGNEGESGETAVTATGPCAARFPSAASVGAGAVSGSPESGAGARPRLRGLRPCGAR